MISYTILMCVLVFAVLASLLVLGAFSKLPEKDRAEVVEITVGTRIVGLLTVALATVLCFNIYDQFQDTITLVFVCLYLAFSITNLRKSTFATKGVALSENTLFFAVAINAVFFIFLSFVGICQLL